MKRWSGASSLSANADKYAGLRNGLFDLDDGDGLEGDFENGGVPPRKGEPYLTAADPALLPLPCMPLTDPAADLMGEANVFIIFFVGDAKSRAAFPAPPTALSLEPDPPPQVLALADMKDALLLSRPVLVASIAGVRTALSPPWNGLR